MISYLGWVLIEKIYIQMTDLLEYWKPGTLKYQTNILLCQQFFRSFPLPFYVCIRFVIEGIQENFTLKITLYSVFNFSFFLLTHKIFFHPETIFSSCYARAGKEGKRLINFRLRPLFYLNLKQKPLFLFLPRGRLEPATSGKLIRALYQLSHWWFDERLTIFLRYIIPSWIFNQIVQVIQ